MGKHIADDIKVVLFDHDDTLVNTISTKFDEHKFIAKTYYNKELSDDEIKKHWGKPLDQLAGILYETKDLDQALAYNADHHQQFEKVIFPETIKVLKHLHDQGKLIGIVTATSRFSFEHDLALHKIPKEIINYTQTADDTPFHKPDPKVFKPAIKWLNDLRIAPHEVLYVGDGLQDMRAALGAKFNFLGVETGLIKSVEFKKIGARSVPNLGYITR
jgi:HAD superfamily hydrolase (TIGR01549 family)